MEKIEKMSSFLVENDLEKIKSFIGEERLEKFLTLTNSKNDEDAIRLHQASMQLNSSIINIIAMIEISIRNVICEKLNTLFKYRSWMENIDHGDKIFDKDEIKTIIKAREKATKDNLMKLNDIEMRVYIKMFSNINTNNDKRKIVSDYIKENNILCNQGDIISRITFHFWRDLFSRRYEQKLWKTSLKEVFPNKKIKRSDVYNNISVLHLARNRIAHHEPIFGERLAKIIEAIEFIKDNLSSKKYDEDSSLSKLILRQTDLMYGEIAIFEKIYNKLCK